MKQISEHVFQLVCEGKNLYVIQDRVYILVGMVDNGKALVKLLTEEGLLDRIRYVVMDANYKGLDALMRANSHISIICNDHTRLCIMARRGTRKWYYYLINPKDLFTIDPGKNHYLLFLGDGERCLLTYYTVDKVLISGLFFAQKEGPDPLEKRAMVYFASSPLRARPSVATVIDALRWRVRTDPVDLACPSIGDTVDAASFSHLLEKYAAWTGDYYEDLWVIFHDGAEEGMGAVVDALYHELKKRKIPVELMDFGAARSTVPLQWYAMRAKTIIFGARVVWGNTSTDAYMTSVWLSCWKVPGKNFACFTVGDQDELCAGLISKSLKDGGLNQIAHPVDFTGKEETTFGPYVDSLIEGEKIYGYPHLEIPQKVS